MRISIGASRKDTHWKVTDLSWEELCERLSSPTRTQESVREYASMSAADKSSRKDVGGFVGGVVKDNGRRLTANIVSRSVVTLDADYASAYAWDNIEVMFDNAACCYSTHSHRPEKPRLRYVVPLDREVTPEEYEPIARQIASDFGIEQFDVTTYETARLFYWPSVPRDGEFFFRRQDGEFVCADAILDRYNDWRDTTEWPISSSEEKVRVKRTKAQGDPTSKPGIVGRFCRTYDVPSAIETFLSDVYEPCADSNRYTYIHGTTAAGVVLYNDGQFAYSHHATDPAGGHLCNAFDLVRLHKFSELDTESDPDTPVTRLPSFVAMRNLASKDPGVKRVMAEELMEKARQAFSDPLDGQQSDDDEGRRPNIDWAAKFDTDQHGRPTVTTNNFVLILENDDNIKGALAINLLKDMPCIVGDVPWRECRDRKNGDQWTDADSAALTHYIETTYGLYNVSKLSTALTVVASKRAFHPVRDYLNGLEWDGVPRGERLFVDYFGAEDSLYTRTVTRKWLTAAVARVMNPGCKFDNLIVLVGSQGIGKSYLGRRLGREWFSDTLVTMQGKDAYDQLKGCWIIEIAELSAMKKSEIENTKMFISKQEDNYRGAYKEFAQVNKRQCVFYGTTNDDAFLRDYTGNRRFWPIGTDTGATECSVFDLTDGDIDQIWAEATHWYKSGESLYLPKNVVTLAKEKQDEFMVDDPRIGAIEEYLDRPIPKNWEEMTKQQRRDYIQGLGFPDDDTPKMTRNTISVPELAYEMYNKEDLPPWMAKEYHNLLCSLPGWRKACRKRTAYGRQVIYQRVSAGEELCDE